MPIQDCRTGVGWRMMRDGVVPMRSRFEREGLAVPDNPPCSSSWESKVRRTISSLLPRALLTLLSSETPWWYCVKSPQQKVNRRTWDGIAASLSRASAVWARPLV